MHVLTYRETTSFETATATFAVETFQGLMSFQILFGQTRVDVYHVGSSVQLGSVMDLITLSLRQLMLLVSHQLNQHVLS